MSKLFVNTIAPNSGDTVTLSGSLVTTGKLTIGDASTDTVAFEAEISSSLIPDVGATYALGTMANSWGSLHVHGLGHIHTASINVVSSSLIPDADNTYDLGSPTRYWHTASIYDIRAFDVQSVNIGNITQAVSFGYFNALSAAQLSGKGTPLGGIISMSAHLHPNTTATVDLGHMGRAFRNLHAHGLGHIHTASIGQVTSSLIPSVDDAVDLGSSTKQWKDLYVDGTANIDTLIVSSSNPNNLVVNGSASVQTTFTSTGTASFNHITSSLIPGVNNQVDLGSSTKQWKDLYVDGTANIDTLEGVATATITSASIENLNLADADISGSLIPDVNATYALGTMANSWGSAHIHGLAHIHTASIGQVTSSLIPSVDDAVDLGSVTKQWKDLYVDGIAYIDTIASPVNITALNGTSINATHITASNLSASTLILNSLVLVSADAAHLGSADGFNKFLVQGQLQAAVADGATSAEFTVGITDIALGDIIVGTAHGALMGGLSQSNMIITTRTANSMSFVFNNESGLIAVDDSAFTASFAIIK